MSHNILTPRRQRIVYPETDGKPMAENTVQFRWIVTLEGGLDSVFPADPNVFVAGDLFWYPVEGHPEIVVAPDTLVVFGRPKGDRRSYLQWKEGNTPHRWFSRSCRPAIARRRWMQSSTSMTGTASRSTTSGIRTRSSCGAGAALKGSCRR